MAKKNLIDRSLVGLRRTLKPFRVHAQKVGLPPGSLVHVGEQKTEKPEISLIDYDAQHLDVHPSVPVEETGTFRDSDSVSWINLTGIHDTDLLSDLGSAFGIHPLALEDILNTDHRPKLEEIEGVILIILKMLHFDDVTKSINIEQVSLVIGRQFVLSFQEREGDVFNGLRERLQRSSSRIRLRGPDYLAYALIDSIVDSYFQILEEIGDGLAEVEEELLSRPDQSTLGMVHHYKRELMLLRKAVWPLREVVSELQKGELELVGDETQVFLRDLYDHTIQVLETIELFRDTISGLQDLYLSSVSNRMNEVMKVLTIMASIFIPVTFIAGVYGMNFEYMPELKWRWGYFAVWGVILGCVLGMLAFFKKKKWL